MLIEYLRAVVAGIAARAWRILSGRPCPCGYCQAHREFIVESAPAYDAVVRPPRGERLPYAVLDEVHLHSAADLDTLAEVRERRGV